MSLGADFIDIKISHNEAQKTNNNAWKSERKALEEMRKTKAKYNKKIERMNKNKNHSCDSIKLDYICKIRSAEQLYYNAQNNLVEASKSLKESENKLDNITRLIIRFIKIPKNCQNNVRIKPNTESGLNVYYNYNDRPLDNNHGHIV